MLELYREFLPFNKKMPSWLDEGLGDYCFTAHQPEPGADHQLGELNHNRLRRIRQAFDEGTSVTFERLLECGQQDDHSNASALYAQGWSMVYFLMQHPEKKRQLIPRLIKDFKRSKDFREPTDKVSKGLDFDELDTPWITFVLRTEPDDPLRTLAREFGPKLPAESLVGPTHWTDAYALWVEQDHPTDADGQGQAEPSGWEAWGAGDRPAALPRSLWSAEAASKGCWRSTGGGREWSG